MPRHLRVRDIDPDSAAEVELVARRMRETLVEVLGDERGEAMYSMEWLQARVRWHLDPRESDGRVLLAETDGEIIGHTIVRVESAPVKGSVGLFSTIYVVAGSRRQGVAKALIETGEAWLKARGAGTLATNTGVHNVRLISLFESCGYRLVLQ